MFNFKDLMLTFGNPNKFIKSRPHSLWHKFVSPVNMTEIDCDYNKSLSQLPKRDNTFQFIAKSHWVIILTFILNYKIIIF